MLSEQIKLHENFGSTHLDAPRNVLVYLPPGYRRSRTRRYPVLYLQDGQNMFDATRLAGLIHNQAGTDFAQWTSPRQALTMATRNGARYTRTGELRLDGVNGATATDFRPRLASTSVMLGVRQGF